MARIGINGRLAKRPPNGNRNPKIVRRALRRMFALSTAMNPLRWGGLVPKSVALQDHRGACSNITVGHTNEQVRHARRTYGRFWEET